MACPGDKQASPKYRKQTGHGAGCRHDHPLIGREGRSEYLPDPFRKVEPQRIVTVAFGAADYTLDMGMEMSKDAGELDYPRARDCRFMPGSRGGAPA